MNVAAVLLANKSFIADNDRSGETSVSNEAVDFNRFFSRALQKRQDNGNGAEGEKNVSGQSSKVSDEVKANSSEDEHVHLYINSVPLYAPVEDMTSSNPGLSNEAEGLEEVLTNGAAGTNANALAINLNAVSQVNSALIPEAIAFQDVMDEAAGSFSANAESSINKELLGLSGFAAAQETPSWHNNAAGITQAEDDNLGLPVLDGVRTAVSQQVNAAGQFESHGVDRPKADYSGQKGLMDENAFESSPADECQKIQGFNTEGSEAVSRTDSGVSVSDMEASHFGTNAEEGYKDAAGSDGTYASTDLLLDELLNATSSTTGDASDLYLSTGSGEAADENSSIEGYSRQGTAGNKLGADILTAGNFRSNAISSYKDSKDLSGDSKNDIDDISSALSYANAQTAARETGQTEGSVSKRGNDEVTGSNVLSQVAEQAVFQIKDGRQEITVHLRPESLGNIVIRLTSAAGETAARIITESLQVGTLIESKLNELKDALLQKGISIDDFQVMYDGNGSGSQHFGRPGDFGREFKGQAYKRYYVDAEKPVSRNASGSFIPGTSTLINCLV